MKHVLAANLVAGTLLLIGCGSTEQTVTSSQGFEQLRASSLTVQQAGLLTKAEEDFARVKAGKKPRNARLKYALRDGGTEIFEGEGYSLTSNGRMETRNGTRGQITGPTIVLHRVITGGRPLIIDEKRFVATKLKKSRTRRG